MTDNTEDSVQAPLEAKFKELFGDIEDEPEFEDAVQRLREDAARWRRIDELYGEGYDFFTRADYHNAIDRFQRAAELAEELGDIDRQCENLEWESECWYFLGKLKAALDRLLQAEELGGGDGGVRFRILHRMSAIALRLPLAKEKQANLLKKLAPYKGVRQFGGSESTVLNCERRFLMNCGDKRGALYRAQEAFDKQVDEYPNTDDSAYYGALADAYRENNRLPEAWRTLYGWRANGSTDFAVIKVEQFRTEAEILYAEGRLNEAWKAILTCQAEEKFLGIYGQFAETLYWIVLIGTDAGKFEETRSALPRLYRFRDSDSLYWQYACHYYHAWYYAGLASYLLAGGNEKRYGAAADAREHAKRWFRRAEEVGDELDELMETDVKRKELDELRAKMGWR